MQFRKILNKIGHLTMAIESIHLLITEYDCKVLEVALTNLKEERQKAASELANINIHSKDQSEEINRLSYL